MNNIHIFSGGTFSPVRNHLSLSAIAFGNTGRKLKQLLPTSKLHLTKMADYTSNLLTNKDIENKVDELLKNPHTKCIIMNAALCDYDGTIDNVESGLHSKRLESREGEFSMKMTPSSKVISKIKSERPDVIVVGFKTITNENDINVIRHKADRMKVDYVFVNDTVTRKNYLISPISEIKGQGDDSRDLLLKVLSEAINNKLDLSFCDILSSNESENYVQYLVRVSHNEYIPKQEAFVKAKGILKQNGFDGKFVNSGWHKDIQGVYIVSIRKNNDLTVDYGKDF